MEAFKQFLETVRSITPASAWEWVRNFDPNNIHDLVNLSGIIFFMVIVGFITLVVYAQITPPSDPVEYHTNAALGAGSEAVHKPGSPPIPPPTQIVSMRVYPIKSCRGIEVDETRLRKTGLLLDRNWMFISKSDRKFMTIRSNPAMTLIDTNIIVQDNQTQLEITVHGKEARVVIPAFPTKEWLAANTTLSEVEIWEEKTDAYEYSDEINATFTKFFEQDVALVYKGPQHRNINVNGRAELYGKSQEHHFADVISLQVASEASLNDLNKRLAKIPGADPLTVERFRPNIIVRGRDDHPWEEDTWKRVRITTNLPDREMLFKLDLDVVARCARCQVPNVNPDTAEKHPKQPWDELMKFRRVDKGGPAKWKPCFGMLCVPKNEGLLMVGSTLEVLETTDKHLYNTTPFKDL
ncbi:hypothetical protein MBLNU13_g03884t1 [Cladosporium sp. NU13]